MEDSKKAWEVAGTKPTACILNAIPDMQKRYSYYGYYDYVETPESKKKKEKSPKNMPSRNEDIRKTDALPEEIAKNTYQSAAIEQNRNEGAHIGTATSFKGAYSDRRTKRKLR